MTNPKSRATVVKERIPGLFLAFIIAAVATLIGRMIPLVGTPVICIVIGVIIAAVRKPGALFRPGIVTSSKLVLQISIVVLGSQLSLGQIMRVGFTSLPVMLGSLSVCLIGAYWIGKWLGIVGDLRTLIGVGTGICGASAIAAVTPIIGAASVDVAYAISTIFLFNVTAVLTFPLIGHLLGMSQHSFGLFAGTAVNDMSSVVAASSTYGTAAANYGIVVKLTRTLLIIPISLALASLAHRRANKVSPLDAPLDPVKLATANVHVRLGRLVPWYLIGFLLVATANSLGLVPLRIHHSLTLVSLFLIAMALAAIGLTTDLPALRRTGPRPLILGAALWVLVSLTSLGLQLVTGSL
ncbi:MAG TPA: putative sulfate exporter family transporter [Candidatus Nanopelagicaceae bacterium]|nr:putative sulfate exporter family transporter [Candidatus Nanopelagicaceae bacterium]